VTGLRRGAYNAPAMMIPFRKMHGLGNDFVVIDGRAQALALDDRLARTIADRRTGVGCDQLIVIEPPRSGLADAFMRIRNADGGEVEACGNATRCVASLLMDEKRRSHVVIETVAGLLDAESRAGGRVAVDMGPARLDWRDIPLAEPKDTLHLGIALGQLADPVGVSMGNPHAVFFVADAEAVDLAALGPPLEHHKLFPQRANIEVAQVLDRRRIRLRVWERGAGITLACGTGACATLVAAARRGLSERRATIVLDGGELEIEWLKADHVLMTGPVATAFTGTLEAA
jgi:diaminopimelate epimerase